MEGIAGKKRMWGRGKLRQSAPSHQIANQIKETFLISTFLREKDNKVSIDFHHLKDPIPAHMRREIKSLSWGRVRSCFVPRVSGQLPSSLGPLSFISLRSPLSLLPLHAALSDPSDFCDIGSSCPLLSPRPKQVGSGGMGLLSCVILHCRP